MDNGYTGIEKSYILWVVPDCYFGNANEPKLFLKPSTDLTQANTRNQFEKQINTTHYFQTMSEAGFGKRALVRHEWIAARMLKNTKQAYFGKIKTNIKK